MGESANRAFLNISPRVQANLVAGARDVRPVRGLTHNFYKYPARFSPAFARAAIDAFTLPGDLILDNHVGGGTTLVEALAAGRNAIGVDISALAEFVARVKTTVLSQAEMVHLRIWAQHLPEAVDVRKSTIHFGDYAEAGYYRHLNDPVRWRIRKAIEQSIGTAIRLGDPRLEAFGRCVVLRTAQWALNSRAKLPSLAEFRLGLQQTAIQMLAGACELREAVQSTGSMPLIEVMCRSSAGIETAHELRTSPPRLVLTSPPYPGLHVLYHRWQVDGRKETPAPFWIAGKLDGAGGSYYTMGDRKYPDLKTYFDNIRATMSSVSAISDDRTLVVQMVSFSDASLATAEVSRNNGGGRAARSILAVAPSRARR